MRNVILPAIALLLIMIIGFFGTDYLNDKGRETFVQHCAERWEGLETKLLMQGNRRMCMVKIDSAWRYEKNIQINVSQ